MRGQALLAVTALAAALVAAQPAAAQGYNSYHDEHVARAEQCQQTQSGRTAGGAVIGGILGAVAGSQISGRGHRTDGSVVGAVAGALLGGAIGNSSARRECDTQVTGQYDPYYGQRTDGAYAQGQYDPRYNGRDPYDDGTGLAGGPYRSDRGDRYARNSQCRWGSVVTSDPDGYEARERVYMCRGRDGVWRPQQRG